MSRNNAWLENLFRLRRKSKNSKNWAHTGIRPMGEALARLCLTNCFQQNDIIGT